MQKLIRILLLVLIIVLVLNALIFNKTYTPASDTLQEVIHNVQNKIDKKEDNPTTEGVVSDGLEIIFMDVGQGDGALISCEGHYMLIDGGTPSNSQKVYAVLKNKGIEHLDVIICSHPHIDHVGGLSGALNYIKSVDHEYCSVSEYESKAFSSFLKYSKVPIEIPTREQTFSLGSATVTMYLPEYTTSNHSIVTRIDYGNHSFLFMGDAEKEEEELLHYANVKADVIKIAHHGGTGSTSKEFFEQVNPSYAILSVGEDNEYGHPCERIMKLLATTEVYRTDFEGDITCISDGKNLSFTTSKQATVDKYAYRIYQREEEEDEQAE
ncbi:MAG: MBL fold metallo-hydrolase [Erysipelotrichaceae bacterium]|nr:MBL fold metallo-hydrolase [Erysipelotrichaceae bacterium]